jgi:peptide/nickel transport system permease protein
MTETKNTDTEKDMETQVIKEIEEEMRLDDARRVKVLSPGMLVFKRFIRNKLAVVGFGILIFMFTFAFIGPLFSPYGQTEVFTGLGSLSKDYAGAIYNKELRYTVAEGEEFSSAARAQFLFALSKNESVFAANDQDYYFEPESENTYRIMRLEPVAEVLLGQLNSLNGPVISPLFEEAYFKAEEDEESAFTVDGVDYRIVPGRKVTTIYTEHNIAIASLNIYDAYFAEDVALVNSFDFIYASEKAIAEDANQFTVNYLKYTINTEDGQTTIYDSDGNEFAVVSNIIVNPLDQSEFLSIDYKTTAREAIMDNQSKFSFTFDDGETVDFTIKRVNLNYYIEKETSTVLLRQYERPSIAHPLGLDNNGMDVMTRLMYGGQVSLLVGFIVVIIEVVIGVIVGGISGYFGGAVDTALMRFVDLFNSIPFYPVVIIFGSVMDTLEVDPMARIFILMMVLGILSWTGIARVVRGQILSLREQDFMVATEATGIRTGRRIFRHLVPNVMPLLIVQATAGLGGIIITEATLGFLGLGVKYPLASWGSIINVSSDAYVMTNFWFMWIPAGLLILLTVLGFNFVGDGLRDAFDPKMKR